MARTYDPELLTDKDWVRSLIGDTDVPDNAILSDEEIDAMVAEVVAEYGSGVHVKYCASVIAATALAGVALAAVNAGDVLSKTVGRLNIRRQSGTDMRRAYDAHIKILEGKCSGTMDSGGSRIFESVAKVRGTTGRTVIG